MRLYRTANGEWTGTEADARTATKREGSKPGSWRKIEVPTDKAGLLAFLNHTKAAPVEAGEARPAPPPPPPQQDGTRWRIYLRGVFAIALRAPDLDAALASARAMMEARPDKAA